METVGESPSPQQTAQLMGCGCMFVATLLMSGFVFCNSMPSSSKGATKPRAAVSQVAAPQRYNIDQENPDSVREFQRGEARAREFTAWPTEIEVDRKVDAEIDRYLEDIPAYIERNGGKVPDFIAYRFGLKSALEKKFGRTW